MPLQGGLDCRSSSRPAAGGPFHGGGGFTPISPTYFSALKIPIVQGRAFTDRDDGGAPGVAIINQTMAHRYWPKGNPLADRISIGKGLGPQFEEPARQIVGVVGDVRDGGLNRDPQPTMYIPWGQLVDAHNANLIEMSPIAWVVRTRGEPHSTAGAIQTELRQASGGLPVARSRTMEEIVVQSTARSDFNMFC